MPVNECIPYFDPAHEYTAHASAAVTGKRLVKISGNRQSGPGLAATAEGSNYVVAQSASATDVSIGVASYDAASGTKLSVLTRGIVPITAGATITAGQRVECDAQGRVVPLATANAVVIGTALSGAASGADAEIQLNLS